MRRHHYNIPPCRPSSTSTSANADRMGRKTSSSKISSHHRIVSGMNSWMWTYKKTRPTQNFAQVFPSQILDSLPHQPLPAQQANRPVHAMPRTKSALFTILGPLTPDSAISWLIVAYWKLRSSALSTQPSSNCALLCFLTAKQLPARKSPNRRSGSYFWMKSGGKLAFKVSMKEPRLEYYCEMNAELLSHISRI
jgi:hypothetical protein